MRTLTGLNQRPWKESRGIFGICPSPVSPGLFFLGLLCLGALGAAAPSRAAAESLWDEESSGYLSEPSRLEPGETVTVVLTDTMSYQYEASRETDKRVDLRLSGGAAGENPFGFLPGDSRSGDTRSAEGSSQREIAGTVTAEAGERREDGTYPLEGSRSVTVDGLTERITLRGRLHPRDLDSRGRAAFTALVQGELILSSFIQDDRGVLSREDVTALEEDGLSDQRRRELLETYLNRFLDVVFSEN